MMIVSDRDQHTYGNQPDAAANDPSQTDQGLSAAEQQHSQQTDQ